MTRAALSLALVLLAAADARAGGGPVCVAPPDGLASWWRGDDDATDAEGSNDGTLQNGAGFAPGRVGQAFSFDGVDDFVSVPDAASLLPQAFTLSAWFQTSALADPQAAFIVARSGPDGITGYDLNVTGNAGNVLRFSLNGAAGGADLVGATDVVDGALHHVVASYDGARMRLFLDGELEAETDVAVTIAYPPGSPLMIGRREFAGVSGLWTGLVDELQLFAGRALCASEIAAIAAAGSAGQCEGGPEPVCLDAYLCYKAKPTKGGPGFSPRNATLNGPFEDLPVSVQKPGALCLPAGLDGGSAEDEATHLEGYKVKPGTAALRPAGLAATTAFGNLTLDTVKVDRLLVPTAKSLGKPPGTPKPGRVDAFQCYTVKGTKGTPGFPKGVQAAVAEQFEASRTLDLKKPKRVCLPVGVDGSPVAQPLGRLLCYPVKPAKGSPKHARRTGVFLANALGAEQVDTVKEEQLCIPADVPLAR